MHESYYGEGEARDGKTHLVVKIGPGNTWPCIPTHKLIFDVEVPIAGSMVVRTTRIIEVPDDDAERNCTPGPPEFVVDVVFDPEPRCRWRGQMTGQWPCKLIKIRRRSIWERLRR